VLVGVVVGVSLWGHRGQLAMPGVRVDLSVAPLAPVPGRSLIRSLISFPPLADPGRWPGWDRRFLSRSLAGRRPVDA